MIAVLRDALWAERWAFVGFVGALALAVVGERLGESQSPWWYLLAAPLGLMCLREIPDSLAGRRARRQERKRVMAVAAQRGHARHARRKDM